MIALASSVVDVGILYSSTRRECSCRRRFSSSNEKSDISYSLKIEVVKLWLIGISDIRDTGGPTDKRQADISE